MGTQMMTRPMVTLKCRGEWQGGARTELHVRDLPPFQTDEPRQAGGTDQGPNPMEYLLGGLIGCSSVMLRMIGAEMNFAYEAATFEAEGDLDLRGYMGDPDVKPYFQRVRLVALVETDEPQERLDEVQRKIETRCPVMSLMKAAGITVDATWEARTTG